MMRFPFVVVLSLALAPILAGCGDDDDEDPTGPGDPTYDLTFAGDASFQGAHGGQDLTVAVVEAATGDVVAEDGATVSADGDLSWELTFADVLDGGAAYYLDYWIDSNFGGGEEGTCDPPENDHQWRIDLGTASADVNLEDTHRPTETEEVCSTFA